MTGRDETDELREATINAYDVLDRPPRRELLALVDLAARVAGVPFATINLFTSDTQHQVATVGFAGGESSRADSFCTFTLDTHEPVHVSYAREDPRFADNPHTTGELASVRYYGAHPLRTPGGVVIGTLCVYDEEVRPIISDTAVDLAMLADRVVDVLELELASRRLTEVNARLERSNARLEAFAGQVSHDLKNPLTSLSLSLELLETDVDERSVAQATIARARRATARMDELIDHLLEFASTGSTPRQEPVDLGAEVAAVIDDMGAWCDTAHLKVGALPHVTGDRSQLRSVMQNLIVNAAKFTDADRAPDIAVSAVEVPGAHRIEVADRGPGVPDEHREHVFAPLARLDRKVPGFGIGLATSQRIVQAHGGRIGVDPREGGGSVFWVELPTVPAT